MPRARSLWVPGSIWVPGASEVLGKICREWVEKEKVDLTFDLITSNGDKDLLTLMAEGQAKVGHDTMGLRVWYVSAQADKFVPMDDVVEPIIEKNGKVSQGWIILAYLHFCEVPQDVPRMVVRPPSAALRIRAPSRSRRFSRISPENPELKAQLAAQHHKLGTHRPDRPAIVLAKVGDRLEVRRQPPSQPHQLGIALRFPFEPPARLHAVEIAVEIDLQ